MPFNEALFWFGLTAFGTGLFVLFEASVKRLYSISLTVIGVLACAYSVYQHDHPEIPAIHAWVILLVLTWAFLGYVTYRRFNQSSPSSIERQSSRLKIISAHWGIEGLIGGDPDKVDCLLERQSGNVFAELVGLDLFHGCNPAKGELRLKVKYSFDGRESTVVRQDGEFLMLPEDRFLMERMETQQERCKEEKREYAKRCLDYRSLLDQYAEEKQELQKQAEKAKAILSPLQLDLMYLARDLRQMLNANPTPVPLNRAGSSEENTAQMIQYKEWSDRIFYHYRDEFAAHLQKIQGAIGKENSSLAMYLTRFVGNGYMQANDIDDLIRTLWAIAIRIEEPQYEIS